MWQLTAAYGRLPPDKHSVTSRPNRGCFLPSIIQSDSKRWIQLNIKRRLNTRQTVGWGIPSSLLTLRVDLRGLRSKLFVNSSHVLLWYTWLAGAFTFTQTAYLLKLMIPATNALPRWRLNVETKTKRTLHSSRRLSFNELTKAKNLVLHSNHFSLNRRCCTTELSEHSSDSVWKLGSPLSNVMYIIHILCIIQET